MRMFYRTGMGLVVAALLLSMAVPAPGCGPRIF